MLKKILLALAVVLVLFLIMVAMQPSRYRVVRSTNISAPQPQVFGMVNDFHQWDAWSPWAKIDPTMKQNFEGAPSGQGALYSWAGNDKVGEGRMTITESEPTSHVGIRLEFLKPFPSTAKTDFSFRPAGSGATTVEWAMEGDSNFMAKAFGLIMGGMDKMIGPDFEKGLRQMKEAAERSAPRQG